MAVYVERNAFRGMLTCHMLADTAEELHAMADCIGLKRAWFQNHRTPHYDVCRTKRLAAIKATILAVNGFSLLSQSRKILTAA
jgi:hypothetical protein